MDAPNARARLSNIRTQTLLLSAVPLLFLISLLVLALFLQSRNGIIASESQHSAQVLSQADHSMQLLDDAGTAIVSYDRTGKSPSLQPYHFAVLEMPGAVATLESMVRDDPVERAMAARFGMLLAQGMVVLRDYLHDVVARDTAAKTRLAESPATRRLSTDLATLKANFNNRQRLATAARMHELRSQIELFTVALVGLCLLGIVVTLAVSVQFGFGISNRIVRLAANARRLAQGEITEAIGGDDEISELDLVYKEMMRRIAREHDRALTLQRALLPQKLPVLPGLRFDSAYTPASEGAEIGGDWYDVFRISDRRVGVSIGDVAGHGLRAAAIMGNARQAMRTVAYIDDDPAGVVGHVNRVLCRNEDGALATAFFATFDLLDGSFRYSIAGHPSPMIVTAAGTVETLPGKGFVLGVDSRAVFETLAYKMQVGSAVVLFTDGLVEADRDYFKGIERLADAIAGEYQNASRNIAEAIQNRIFEQTPPRDDSALLFMAVTALGKSALQPQRRSWSFDARLETSARRVKRALLWHLGELAGNGADLSPSEMLLGELIGNVARHTPGPARVSLEWNGDDAIVRVSDRGGPFRVPANGHVAEVLDESGRGLFLVGAIARSFSVERTVEGNCVSAVLPLAVQTNGVAPPSDPVPGQERPVAIAPRSANDEERP